MRRRPDVGPNISMVLVATPGRPPARGDEAVTEEGRLARHVGVEQLHELGDVSARRTRRRSVRRSRPVLRHRRVPRWNGRRIGSPVVIGWRASTGDWGAIHHLGDGFEREVEDVVEHEGGPLGGREPIENGGDRDLHLFSESHPIDGIGDPTLVQWMVSILDPPGRGLAVAVHRGDLVEAETTNDHQQPGANVLDLIDALRERRPNASWTTPSASARPRSICVARPTRKDRSFDHARWKRGLAFTGPLEREACVGCGR